MAVKKLSALPFIGLEPEKSISYQSRRLPERVEVKAGWPLISNIQDFTGAFTGFNGFITTGLWRTMLQQ
jgi:hypothetical protein